jgi:hypothetical protein
MFRSRPELSASDSWKTVIAFDRLEVLDGDFFIVVDLIWTLFFGTGFLFSCAYSIEETAIRNKSIKFFFILVS